MSSMRLLSDKWMQGERNKTLTPTLTGKRQKIILVCRILVCISIFSLHKTCAFMQFPQGEEKTSKLLYKLKIKKKSNSTKGHHY